MDAFAFLVKTAGYMCDVSMCFGLTMFSVANARAP